LLIDIPLVSASLLTLILSLPTLLSQNLASTSHLGSYILHSLRILLEFILLAFWAAAFVTMLLPKGKDFKLLFEKPPYVEWDCAVALAAIEM